VYARAKRWKVIGLDLASPWNPQAEDPSWSYRVCRACGLRFRADCPRCPRCRNDSPGQGHPAYEFGGFLGRRDESPILDEEERFAERNLVRCYPQWDGDVVARWMVGPGWGLRLSRGEEVHWLNEGPAPTAKELEGGAALLHPLAKGYLLCPACGAILTPPAPPERNVRGRQRARGGNQQQDKYGHRDGCRLTGAAPRPMCLATASKAEVLRLVVPVPPSLDEAQVNTWGLSLGYSLHAGMRHLYMLEGQEIEFELEGPWTGQYEQTSLNTAAIAFVDASLGGTGYLRRIGEEFHKVAERAIEHLDHPNCETACYRCLKAYQNQRHHEFLSWPRVLADLEELAQVAPEARPLEVGDIDDPRPWLEAYAAGVGSPLELKFLRLFERHGFHPEKQIPVSAKDGEPAISIADFAVAASQLAIYIDGAAFHVGSNLRRDRYIRNRLRNGSPPWRVEELRAADLAAGSNLVERLKAVARRSS
jgi:hypothetical protein